MNDSFEMELSLEHINPELVDLPVCIDVDVYKGTTEGLTSEDPGEITILKVIIQEERKYIENKVEYTLRKGDEIRVRDAKMENQIYEYYENRNSH